MIKLYRKSSVYRVLYIMLENGQEIEIENIYIYDENGIIANTGRGYFDNDIEIEINGNIRRKIKIDFKQKENFVIKDKDNLYSKRYNLYIYKKNADLQFLGFRKQIDLILSDFSLNGGEFSMVHKRLPNSKYKLSEELKEELSKLETYKMPLEEKKIKDIFNKIIEINKILLKEKKDIENFNVDLMAEEKQNIIERLK